MVLVAQTALSGGPWLDAILDLPKGGWIAAGYASGLVTHGAQLAPPGRLRLFALPVLAGEGPWRVVAGYAQAIKIQFAPRAPGALPPFVPSPDCHSGCAPFECPMSLNIQFEPEPEHALSFPATGLVVIDPDWWGNIRTIAGRLAILGHEIGHLMGAACQRCADFYAGAYLRAFGISDRDAIQTFDAAVETRDDAALSLAAGGIEYV